MSDIFIHPQTKSEVEAFLGSDVHALLLSGPKGSGKNKLAQYIAGQILKFPTPKLESYQYFLQISPQNNTISIAEVRKLIKFLQLKTTGTNTKRRVVIVEDLQMATQEAQNALLKSLEEPPDDTILILTGTASTSILETIYSRVQQIEVKKPSIEELQEYFGDEYSEKQIKEAYNLSSGLVGLTTSILQGDEHHLGGDKLEIAKKLLTPNIYDRLVLADSTLSDKQYLDDTLKTLAQISSVAINRAAEAGKDKEIKRWYRVSSEVKLARGRLDHSVNSKLVITDLLLHL